MSLTQSCDACGESIAYEYATGDRSGLCWREDCRRRREERARRFRLTAPPEPHPRDHRTAPGIIAERLRDIR